MSFNLLYYPLVFRAGREGAAIPGMQVLQAPAGAHRHRQHDLLAMLLTISGDHRYDPEEIQELAKEAGQTFFRIQGSVTRAMQTVTENINKQIFDRNLDRGYEGVRALGTINLAVIHNDWLFIGQFGSTQAVFINTDMVEHIGGEVESGEFLGLSRRIQMRYSQNEINDGDLLVLCEQSPESWTVQNLAGSAGLAMDIVKRRLMNQVVGSLEALVIKFPEGRGLVEIGNWDEPQTPQEVDRPDAGIETISGVPTEPPVDLVKADQSAISAVESGVKTEDKSTPLTEEIMNEEIAEEEDKSQEVFYMDAGEIQVKQGETEKPFEEGEQPLEKAPLAKGPSPFMVWLANAWLKMKNWNEKLTIFSSRFSQRFGTANIPGRESTAPLVLLVMALAIPAVLILSSLSIYSRSGKAEEHQELMTQAQEAAALAEEAQDAADQRAHWAQALDLVTQAHQYQTTTESQAFFDNAQTTLDDLDLAERLDFTPALTDFFPEEVVVSRIESSSSGVYLLDDTTGSVLRISMNSKGFYELDAEFQCAPGPYGLVTVGKLVDFVVLPANEDNYRVMALDESGNLLYCQPGEYPDSRTLSTPKGGWGRIIGAAYDENMIYVLDAEKSAIWMYEGVDREDEDKEGIIFSLSPTKFLDEDVPDMGGAIDLTVNEEDMYILHEDGHMTLCRYSALKDVKLTECQDPAPYNDDRAGREKSPWIFMDSRFELMQQTQLPNTAIYILDGVNRSINKFGYQMNLERVLKPQSNRNYPIPDEDPTGFGITSDLEVFLAYGNQLFIAPLQ